MIKSFAIENEELMQEWDWDKNNELGLFPDKLSVGSNKKVWWKCELGHSYQSAISWHTQGGGCPYCSHNKVLVGYNDLATTDPDLVLQWNYEKNGDLTPQMVSRGSGKKVWWICDNGHEWQSSINKRTSYEETKCKCPICWNRATSFSEQTVYYYIKQIFPDAINSYKDIFKNNSELDIYIPSLNIGIEYDGIVWHNDDRSYQREIKKYNICKEHNIKLVRLREFLNNDYGSFTKIFYGCKNINCDEVYAINIKDNTLRSGSICLFIYSMFDKNISVDIDRDAKFIRESYLGAVNNPIIDYEEIMKYWDYSKNICDPKKISFHSTTKVFWICPICGVSFEKMVCDVYHDGQNYLYNCPECSKKAGYKKVSDWHKKAIQGTNINDKHDILMFDSQKEASAYFCSIGKKIGNSQGGLSSCLNGKQKSAYGYYWKFVEK